MSEDNNENIVLEEYESEFSYKKNKSNLKIQFNRIAFIFFIFLIISLIYSIQLLHLGSLKQNIKNIYIYDPLNKSLNNISEKKLKNYKFDLIVFLVNHNNFKKLNFKLTRILDYRY